MINTSTMIISPSTAKKYLELNKNNRPLISRHVEYLARQIINGSWKLNGESIKLGKDRLIDGQHRLAAIIKSGKSIKTLVSTGLDEDVFDTVDTGRNRGGSDILALLGEKNTNNLAALLLTLNKYYNTTWASADKVSNVELEALLEQFPDSRDFTSGRLRATGLFSPKVINFCHYVFSQKNKEEAEKFIVQMCTGNDLPARHPVHALRNKVMNARLAGSKFSSNSQIVMVFKAWNLVRDGVTTSRLHYKSGEKIQKAK